MKATVTSVLVLLAISHATLADPAAPDNVPASCLNKNFNVDPFECCKTPKLLDEGTVKECVHSFPPPQNAQDEIKPDCMSECVMNSTRIFDRRQNVNDAKAMETFLEKLNGKSVWAEIVQKAVKQCLDDADNRKEEFSRDMKALQQKFPKERICSPAAGFIMECVHVSVYKNCPASIFKDNLAGCPAIKKHLNVDNCPFYTIFPEKKAPKPVKRH
ncbi:AAEL011494-PA [Aedes aegypti]|uniref:AAEL011494-PA n=1 Tax=Aedes aegypti TaxID=7159 RepID=Q16PY2_AEDAE|nr:AAEL011494-PA [Aedes aegypti]